jgi:hypothetical protein
MSAKGDFIARTTDVAMREQQRGCMDVQREVSLRHAAAGLARD